MDNKDIFAKNLSYYINHSGKSQKELAEIWDIPASTLNCWVNGLRFPRYDKLEFVANYFGVTKSDLIEVKTGADGTDLSIAKRKMIDLAKSCSDDEADRLVQMMQLFLNKK